MCDGRRARSAKAVSGGGGLLTAVAGILQPAQRTPDGTDSYARRSGDAYPHWGLNE